MKLTELFGLIVCLVFACQAGATGQRISLDTRPGVRLPVFYMQRDGALATVILLPGGSGSLGAWVDGQPTGNNFLVRSREFFADAGLNVAVMGRASDQNDLDYPDRMKPEHLQDIQKLIAYLKTESSLPVWLVGTSRGTVSATSAAIAFGDAELAGVVLSSSVVDRRKVGAVPTQNLAAIHIPVLVIHHAGDACRLCKPAGVPAILDGLHNAPVKRLVMVRGGANPAGDACASTHHHGYIGIEQDTVRTITDWLKQPTSW